MTLWVKVFLPALLLVSVSTVVIGNEAEDNFDTAWKTADAARQQAAKRGHEWRDTEQMLEDAKQLASEGDYEQAMKLVTQAQFESERAVEQAEQQATLWQDAVLK